jgi:hypothetical protein
MPRTSNPVRTPDCKIKRVNPAFRSVSTPRRRKDLRAVGPVNPGSALRGPTSPIGTHRCSPNDSRTELTPSAWKRLFGAAASHQASVEQLLQLPLSEVA